MEWGTGWDRQRELGAPHTPVMLQEVLEWLRIKPDGIYVDATLGAGGHSAAIAARLSSGRLISLDRDAQALVIARERLKEFASRVTFVHTAFSRIAEAVQGLGIVKVDGVLADLGVSSMQLDQPERGFSFREAGPLDMRMSSGELAEDELTAEEIVNRWPEKELADLLYREAEERDSRRIARGIVASATHKRHRAPGNGCGRRSEAMGKAETASRDKNVSGAADSGESRVGGTRAVSFPNPCHFKFWRTLGGVDLPLSRGPPGEARVPGSG